ncbi:putative ATP-grasp-modified RiPP [Streptosporangium sp. NPDC006007]|uniref:putative ATP-grasp-modified RiPP n=1 Tax=Streptosporangium sp. NPDC006007 TaxID=3154575 RepID=UPI0033AE394A
MGSRHRQPWGLTRSAPFPPAAATPVNPFSVELDPDTQIGIYRDEKTGQIIEAGKHGTNRETSKRETTGRGGDGKSPQDSDEITITDYSDD